MVNRAPNINRSRVHEDMVQSLAMEKMGDAERTLFPTIRELLCFAALLGFSEGRRVPLDRTEGVEDVSYQQFERGDAEDLIYLLALAETKDPNVLKDGNESECAQIFEEYANGGFEVIKDVLLKSGGEYPDKEIMAYLREKGYLLEDENDADLTKVSF